ncbi:HEAT repeat domain-containing protein [uncultured Cellulomonas sp.]|uniref:HEAT repeat domain-containing protein n=1 Tax=uncultured Cellulomonas sp. TaxID=189682 RepID=UPI0028EA5E4F|nr:HEAT repeat domain-containing protein [uncultured Cellulomonas sp.]
MSTRVVLAPTTSRAAFHRLAGSRGWVLRGLVDPTADEPYEEIWRAPGGAVHYVEDDRLGVASVVVLGDDAEALAAEVTGGLDTLGTAEAMAWFAVAVTDEQRRQAVSHVAATAERVDPGVVSVLEEALTDPSPRVRRAALYAAAHLSWPEVLPAVAGMVSGDPDPDLRAWAGRAARAIADGA